MATSTVVSTGQQYSTLLSYSMAGLCLACRDVSPVPAKDQKVERCGETVQFTDSSSSRPAAHLHPVCWDVTADGNLLMTSEPVLVGSAAEGSQVGPVEHADVVVWQLPLLQRLDVVKVSDSTCGVLGTAVPGRITSITLFNHDEFLLVNTSAGDDSSCNSFVFNSSQHRLWSAAAQEAALRAAARKAYGSQSQTRVGAITDAVQEKAAETIGWATSGVRGFLGRALGGWGS